MKRGRTPSKIYKLWRSDVEYMFVQAESIKEARQMASTWAVQNNLPPQTVEPFEFQILKRTTLGVMVVKTYD